MSRKLTLWLAAGLISAAALSGCAGQTSENGAKQAQEEEGFNPRGQILALSCASCHGTDGESVGIIPGFFGKSSTYLENALLDFKNERRYSTVMGRHAKGYSDDEIKLIAEYFGWVSQQTTSN